MILEKINKAYWYIGIMLYVVFYFPAIKSIDYLYLYLASLVTFISFGIVISATYKRKNYFFTKQNLILTVFFYSLFIVDLYHLLSYTIDGDTFVFSKSDAVYYFNGSMRMSTMNIKESFEYMFQSNGFDDYGAFLWISSMFRIIPSQVFLNFSYCVLGAISAVMLFNIGRTFMPRRYAYMAALTFSIASFTLYYHSICLKESVMMFLIIASFNSFYSFFISRNIWSLISAFLWAISLLLFRVPVSLLLIISFSLTLALIYFKGFFVPMICVIIALMVYFGSFLFSYSYDRYLRGGDVDLIVERKMELARGGGFVNQMADPLAAAIGPFPSIVSKAITSTSLNASGLLYRLLLAFPFLLGTFYVFRYRYIKLYPLVIFFLINAIGVAISVKGLEVRLSFPHLAMMYLVAFWLLAMYDYRRIKKQLPKKVIYGCLACLITICLLWNLRGV